MTDYQQPTAPPDYDYTQDTNPPPTTGYPPAQDTNYHPPSYPAPPPQDYNYPPPQPAGYNAQYPPPPGAYPLPQETTPLVQGYGHQAGPKYSPQYPPPQS